MLTHAIILTSHLKSMMHTQVECTEAQLCYVKNEASDSSSGHPMNIA